MLVLHARAPACGLARARGGGAARTEVGIAAYSEQVGLQAASILNPSPAVARVCCRPSSRRPRRCGGSRSRSPARRRRGGAGEGGQGWLSSCSRSRWREGVSAVDRGGSARGGASASLDGHRWGVLSRRLRQQGGRLTIFSPCLGRLELMTGSFLCVPIVLVSHEMVAKGLTHRCAANVLLISHFCP